MAVARKNLRSVNEGSAARDVHGSKRVKARGVFCSRVFLLFSVFAKGAVVSLGPMAGFCSREPCSVPFRGGRPVVHFCSKLRDSYFCTSSSFSATTITGRPPLRSFRCASILKLHIDSRNLLATDTSDDSTVSQTSQNNPPFSEYSREISTSFSLTKFESRTEDRNSFRVFFVVQKLLFWREKKNEHSRVSRTTDYDLFHPRLATENNARFVRRTITFIVSGALPDPLLRNTTSAGTFPG